jgi:hypothetical protein
LDCVDALNGKALMRQALFLYCWNSTSIDTQKESRRFLLRELLLASVSDDALSNPLPRKGTETGLWFGASHITQLSNPLPRKGTETIGRFL